MKIIEFMHIPDRKILVITKIKIFLQSIMYKTKYGRWGINALIWKPDRILGKSNIFLGDDVYIMHHARIECIPQNGQLHIGNGTSIEERCHIIAASKLCIGKDCVISADVFISDCNHRFDRDTSIMSQKLEIKETNIGNHCFIGIGAKIMPGVKLGDFCVVGANAVVTHSFPNGSIVAGVPARQIGVVE